MTDQPDDNELEERLRRAVAHFDPVPPRLLKAALESFTWRTVDAELAELVFDSLVDQDDAVLVRGLARLLSFEAPGLTIEIEVTSTEEARRLIGQLAPPQRAVIELRQGRDVTTVEADELGRFRAGPVRAGPFSLRCDTGEEQGRHRVVTDWVSI